MIKFTSIVFSCASFVLLNLAPAALAATTASRTPQCMAITNTVIKGGFLNQNFPAWLFTNHCKYAVSFYVEYPGVTVWVPFLPFAPNQSVGYLSSGKPASLVRVLECPSGWSALGLNPAICYK